MDRRFILLHQYNIFCVGGVAFFLLYASCTPKESAPSLIDENFLSSWDTWIGPGFDSMANKFENSPVGLNKDPLKVFTVHHEEDEHVLRITGEHFGGISTKKEFQNYHLKMEFKWGEEKHQPKKKDNRDSGLLYHAVGDHGADGGFWMRSQEFQIQEGDCGDYWGVAGGSFEIPASEKDSGKFVYDQHGKRLIFNEASSNGRRCRKNPDAEKPTGEWNIIELYCYGDTAVHVMNGKVVMVLYSSKQLSEGELEPLKRGKIQIQSEGAEVYYKNLTIESIKEIPADLIN